MITVETEKSKGIPKDKTLKTLIEAIYFSLKMANIICWEKINIEIKI